MAYPFYVYRELEVTYCADAYEVAKDSDALVLFTEWDEFKKLNMPAVAATMKNPLLSTGGTFMTPTR